jgi:hypothetical protein
MVNVPGFIRNCKRGRLRQPTTLVGCNPMSGERSGWDVPLHEQMKRTLRVGEAGAEHASRHLEAEEGSAPACVDDGLSLGGSEAHESEDHLAATTVFCVGHRAQDHGPAAAA